MFAQTVGIKFFVFSLGIQTIRVIEVGSWKGLSSVTMGDICINFRPKEFKCTLIAIDTWLGWPALYTHPNHPNYNDLESNESRSPLFDTFLKNVKLRQLDHVIRPFRLSSADAANVLQCYQMKADFIYIDGDHEYEAVKRDLEQYYEILSSGGLFFGDDWTNVGWSVRKAVMEFSEQRNLSLLNNKLGTSTWLLWKP